MAIVTTGQITIVDNNDARPITAHISVNPGLQQVYTKNDTVVTYNPNWQTANSNTGLVLTARVFAGAAGSAVDVTGQLSNRRWSFDLANAITGSATLISANATMAASFVSAANHTFTTLHNAGGSTFTIRSNLLPDASQATIYFEGDYTDPVTGLVSKVVASIVLGVVRTGTNAVYVLAEGTDAIEQATGATKNVAVMAARLVRSSGIDTAGVEYRWYENNGGTQIINSGAFTSKYGLKSIGGTVAPTGALGEIGAGLPASGAWTSNNCLVIHESAIQDLGVFRVEVRDTADDPTAVYQTYFTVTDFSDPYDLRILSSAGDKLQNGVGSTTLTPEVFYGSVRVSSLTGWSFKWTFFNKNGFRGAFTDPNRSGAGGRNISANTATVFTYDGTAIVSTPVVGDIIKVVTAGGDERFYEVASASGSTITVRAPTTHASWLTTANFPMPTASQFVGGRLFMCKGAGASQGQVTTTALEGLIVSGDDIDAKGRIICEGDRP
jgi:hypothetical protein